VDRSGDLSSRFLALNRHSTMQVVHLQCSDCCQSPLSGLRSVSANKTTFSPEVGDARSVSDARYSCHSNSDGAVGLLEWQLPRCAIGSNRPIAAGDDFFSERPAYLAT